MSQVTFALPDRVEPPRADWHWNFAMLALHHIVLRIGWIFKTETVIMPGFLDALGAGGAMRGWLPVLGRIGQSVPQFFYANRVRAMPRQKWAMGLVTLGQAVPWVLLGMLTIVWQSAPAGWMQVLFLVTYAVFNVTYGNWLLLSGTIQGKLIPVHAHGRLLGVSNFVGCSLAAAAAFLWLGVALQFGLSGYAVVFLAVGAGFVLSSVFLFAMREWPTPQLAQDDRLRQFLHGSLRLVVGDANFRRLVVVVTLYYMVLILFPHYGSYARERLGLGEKHFMIWVVVQNLMNAVGSGIVGPIADRRGNRVALAALTLLAAATPLAAMAIAAAPDPWGRRLYWLVFVLLGFTPLTQRIIVNYALEVSQPSQHALYLGTLNLVQGLPLMASPLVGWLMDATSFEVVFTAGAVTILVGGILAQGLADRATPAARD